MEQNGGKKKNASDDQSKLDINKDFLNDFDYYEKVQYNWKLFYSNKKRNVFKGINKDDQKKEIYVKKIEILPKDYQEILKELYFLVLLYGKDYFVQINGILFSKDKKCIYFIFKGNQKANLRNIIKCNNNVYLKNRELIRWIIFQISCALYCFHSNNFVHNDIKPENIVIDNRGTIEICDFGTATLKGKGNIKEYTQSYSSPEFLLKKETDEKSDMWSFGLIIAELLLLNKDKDCYLNPENILNIKDNKNDKDKKIKDEEFLKFIFSKCGIDIKSNDDFQKLINEEKKIIFTDEEKQKINDQNMLDLLDNLLVLNSKKRYSAEKILTLDYLKEYKEYYTDNLKDIRLDLEELENPFDNDYATNMDAKTFEIKCKNLIRIFKNKNG